jgi:hypothetical protein
MFTAATKASDRSLLTRPASSASATGGVGLHAKVVGNRPPVVQMASAMSRSLSRAFCVRQQRSLHMSLQINGLGAEPSCRWHGIEKRPNPLRSQPLDRLSFLLSIKANIKSKHRAMSYLSDFMRSCVELFAFLRIDAKSDEGGRDRDDAGLLLDC